MNELISIDRLKEHPKNTYFFDDVTGGKWEELLESIRSSGVYERIIITPDRTIVSGHQRVRACKELGIDEIKYEMRDFENEDDVLKCLIETNTKQRGTVADSDLKQGRRYLELERIYGIKNGGDRKSERHSDVLISQGDLAKKNGVSIKTWQRKKDLTNLIEPLQQLSLREKITTKVALIYSALPPDEQLEIYNTIGEERISDMTYDQTKEEVKQLKSQYESLESEHKKIKTELEQEKKKTPLIEIKEIEKEVIVDNTDYDSIKRLEQELNCKNKEIDKLKVKEEYLSDQMKVYERNSNEYEKLKKELENLTKKREEVSRSIHSATELSGLVAKIDGFIKRELSPINYSNSLNYMKDNYVVQQNIRDIVGVVQKWCDDMSKYIEDDNKNIINVEVM